MSAWTTTDPTTPGWYWLRWYGYVDEPERWMRQIVQVAREACEDGQLSIESCELCGESTMFDELAANRQWQGPLMPVEESPDVPRTP